MLGAPGTAIQAYDQNAWVVAGQYNARNAQECVEVFRAARAANLGLLKRLKP